jgi:hypothetical protein
MYGESSSLKAAHVQVLPRMEPTGIEPVTSCLQNARSRADFSPASGRFTGVYGWPP